MDPIARSLDTLQGDKTMSMGYLLPTVAWLSKQLEALSTTAGTCKELAVACKTGVDRRFTAMTLDSTIILSSIAHPKFKFRWMKGAIEKDEARELFKSEVEASRTPDEPDGIQAGPKDDDDFLFNDDEEEAGASSTEFERFLSQPFTADLQSLSTFPTIKNIFLRYNTALPSSASVERLFSVAGDICSRKRASMTDRNFEDTLIYRYNINTLGQEGGQ